MEIKLLYLLVILSISINSINTNTIPTDWIKHVNEGSYIYGEYPSNPNLLPNLGNGFIGTVIDSGSIYLAGLYCKKDHFFVFKGS